ncbi:MAG TPA: MaoC/PaaZ C-terminal domain-containing protein [Amycolatopsis sp.]|nr:MaoC/PaaZ C-terminal domain-containing protein [Amycolatopsis sp.]
MSETTTLTWSAVKVGDPIPRIELEITRQRLVVAAGGERDFNPLHFDDERARAAGFEAAFANGFFLQAVADRAVMEFLGAAGELRRMSMRIFRPVYVGRQLSLTGSVTGRHEDAGWGVVAATLDLCTKDGRCASVEVEGAVPTVSSAIETSGPDVSSAATSQEVEPH